MNLSSVLPRTVRRHPVFWGLGLLLVLALAGTWAAKTHALQEVRGHLSERRAAVSEQALQAIEKDFAALQSELRTQAQSLAEDTMVVRGLRQWSAGEARPSTLIRHLSDLRVGDRTAVEVYAPTPRLLAWTGVHMPLDDAPDGDLFLESPQTAVSVDGDVRRGLAVWWPVRENDRSMGVVRVVRVVEYQPPVQNRYIQGYSLESKWTEQTGESVSVAWGAPSASETASPPDTLEAADPHVDLTSPAGTFLGRVTVSRPPPERFVQMREARYDDLLALWAALGLLWAAVGAWGGYARLAHREGLGASMEALKSAALRFLGVTVVWWAARYALIALDVPGRWQADGSMLDPLFEPSYLASTFGFGLMRSTGDLLLTGTFGILYAVGFLHFASNFRLSAPSLPQLAERIQGAVPGRPSSVRFLSTLFLTVTSLLVSVFILATYVRRAVLDSTLDFFSRTGLLPQPLVLVVLCALFLLVVGTVLIGVGLLWVALRLLVRYRPQWWSRGIPILSVAVVIAIMVGAAYLGTSAREVVPLPVTLGFLGILGGAAAWGLVWPHEGFGQLTLRGLLPSVLALTVLLYPMLYEGMDTQRREHMMEAAASFEAGRDPRALFSIEQVLRTAQRDLGPLLQAGARGEDVAVDSVATRLVRRSLLASLTSYEASFTLFTSPGTPLYRYTAAGLQTRRTQPEPSDRAAFEILQGVYQIQGGTAPLVEQIRSDRLNDRRSAAPFQYAGLIALSDTSISPSSTSALDGGDDRMEEGQRYWGLLRAEPRSLLPGTGGGVPRVLLPDGSYSDLYAELSLAEFRGGTLTRSLGREFGRAQLPADLRETIETNGTRWRSETVRDRQYLTYYRAHRLEATDETAIIAVRIPSVLAFDHLYYLLRLTVAGLCVGLIVYLLGVAVRYRRGLLPAPRVRFRDKVLNAFLVVGVVSMISVGVVGVQVVTGENERVIERRLHDDLSRVEETLAMQAERGERTYEVAQRIDVDALSARVGLDVHVYRGGSLISTSRPRLVRDRLVDERLPSDVYHALYGEAYRFTSAPSSIGGFEYRVGYQALTDDDGTPQVVVAVPTLAQQERIEEEQARTLAYLFGALLLLVVVVMLTALLLSNALARPIAQLREGLEAVGEGRFTRVLPVDTRDEIGDLVQTFNEMREQLAESRRKLAQQERELAWREMARQVAHEIKNPLTPMKLSIQHLRRAFQREQTRAGDDEAPSDKFAGLFDRITSTLIEQIEALARIANEFSTFARLPTRVMETLDLNEVIREAVDLMQEDTDDATLDLDLHPEPLVVEADREELRRIYINLIKNALQAVPDHREGRIEITTDRVEPSGDAAPGVRSTIRDNGTGIPDDLRDKIFQPNFSTKTSGTGLGLAIARKGIEELDGQIGFETTEGEGTTFWIRLPLSEEAAVEVEPPDEG